MYPQYPPYDFYPYYPPMMYQKPSLLQSMRYSLHQMNLFKADYFSEIQDKRYDLPFLLFP